MFSWNLWVTLEVITIQKFGTYSRNRIIEILAKTDPQVEPQLFLKNKPPIDSKMCAFSVTLPIYGWVGLEITLKNNFDCVSWLTGMRKAWARLFSGWLLGFKVYFWLKIVCQLHSQLLSMYCIQYLTFVYKLTLNWTKLEFNSLIYQNMISMSKTHQLIKHLFRINRFCENFCSNFTVVLMRGEVKGWKGKGSPKILSKFEWNQK